MVAKTARSITVGLSLRQPILNRATKDKCTTLKQFIVEAMNILIPKHYDISDAEKVPIVKDW